MRRQRVWFLSDKLSSCSISRKDMVTSPLWVLPEFTAHPFWDKTGILFYPMPYENFHLRTWPYQWSYIVLRLFIAFVSKYVASCRGPTWSLENRNFCYERAWPFQRCFFESFSFFLLLQHWLLNEYQHPQWANLILLWALLLWRIWLLSRFLLGNLYPRLCSFTTFPNKKLFFSQLAQCITKSF